VAANIGPARRRLGARLRELRATRFRSGSAFAAHLGWLQSRVSKLETGAQLPSEADLDTWVAATGASERVRAELAELVMAARLDYQTFGEIWAQRGGIAAVQDALAAEEAAAGRIGTLQFALIPGLVQTVAYARELLTARGSPLGVDKRAEIDGLIAARMRRQNVLYMPGKKIQLVIGEAALRMWYGSPDALRGQRDRLVQAIDLPGVEIGILPFDRPNPVPGLTGFNLHDSDVVFLESLAGEQRITDPDEVAIYVRAFEAAREVAITGADAVALIRSIK
jgi:transcriptional regulator with XRE-family HTH domain